MPIISAVVGAIGAAIGLGSVGISLASAAIGIGLNFVAAKIQANQAKKNSKQASGTQFEKDYGENVSRKVPCGLVGLAGHDCYVNTYGSSNKLLEQIYVLSDFPCDGLSKIWAGGKELKLETTDNRIYTVSEGDYAGRMSFVFNDGTQALANASLIEHANPSGRWTADHRGSGICYLIVRMTYDQEKLAQFPDFFFEIRGARLYDFRKDTTKGGSGSHRFGQYSTYEFSENPIIQDYNYRRGFSWNGDVFLGMEMTEVDLPFDRYVAAANICDEQVGGEKRYRCSIILDADVDHGDNIDAIMTSCGGIVIDGVEGSWPMIGTAQPIIETLTDDDLIITEAVRFQRRRSMAELTNSVSGTYLDPGNLWSPVGYDMQSDPTQVALDRRTRDVQINFDTVRSKRQANQLASIYYNENRYEATADIVLRPRFQTIKVGDWIRWNSERYGDRVYMVQSRAIRALTSDGPRNVVLSLQERNSAIYDQVGLVAPTVPIPNSEPIYLNELQDWSVIPVIATGADGRSYPAFRMSWSAIDDVTVRGVAFEWWIKTAPENKFSRQVEPDLTIAFIQEGILSLTEYQFRHKLIADRPTNWVQPITVTSVDGGNNFLVELENLGQELRDKIDILSQWIGDELADRVEENAQALLENAQALVAEVQNRIDAVNLEQSARVDGAIEASSRYRAILDEIGTIRDYASNADYAQYQQKEELRRTLTQRLNDVYAEFDERITVATGVNGGVVERITTLEVKSDEANAAIVLVDSASVDRDNAIFTQLGLLSAGTDNQFDPAKLWLFDTSLEGWTGNGSPSIASGYLRPGNHASDPYVASPVGLASNANQYRQVRARVRKSGDPLWEGFAWWRTVDDATWDAARRAVVDEPIYDVHGIGLITFDMPWTGSIDQIRIDLSSSQTATDYFEFDWISIGAPSPGASRAELLTEQSARASGDSANAQSITALQALFQDVNGDVTALASGVSVLTTQVSNLEGGVLAQGQALDSLTAEVAGKASVTALQSLSAEVEAIGGGGIVSQGQALTAIRNELQGIAAEVLDQDYANFLGQQAVRGALAEASQSLSTRIDITNNSLTLVAEAVTRVQAVLPGLASAQAVTALSSRVSSAEGSIKSSSAAISELQNEVSGKATASALQSLSQTVSQQGQTIISQGVALTSVQNTLGGKANASALQSLSNTVSQQGETLTSQSAAVVSLQNSLAGKASTSALQSLSQTVNQQGQTLTSQGQSITSLSNSLAGKASTSALQSLSSTVSDQGGKIAASATALTALSTTVDGVTADARFKMEVVSGPSGYTRIAFRARSGDSGGYRDAGLYLDVPANTSLPTQVLIDAQRFAVISGSDKTSPFVFENGEAKLAVANIGTVTAGIVALGKVRIDTNGIVVSS